MPRIARFKIAAIDELFKQLRFTPATTRMRQMDNAEQLVTHIDPSINYPEQFIVYRITGYRPDGESSTMLVGEALLPDLVNFVLRISRDLALPPNYNGRTARPLGELASTLNVATKTIERYRKRGLVCHYVHFPPNRQLLACFDDAMERFVASNDTAVKRAAGFTRIDAQQTREMIEVARELCESRSATLNDAALELAERFGRAHETVRLVLRKHDRVAAEPIFTAPGPITDREALLIYRAWRWGVPVRTLANRFGKAAMTIHRAINRQRSRLLMEIPLDHVLLPTFKLDDAASIILCHTAVTRELNTLPQTDDALTFISAARRPPEVVEDHEHALLAGYNFLKHRAQGIITALPDWPGSQALDAAETDLRWASMLKRKLVALAFPAGLRSIEQHLNRTLQDQPSEVILSSIQTALIVVGSVVDMVNPARHQRLHRMAGHAVDRALAAGRNTAAPNKAAARHRDGSVRLVGPFAQVTAWSWLDPPSIAPAHLAALGDTLRQLVTLRFGLDGTPPQTCAALAERFDRTGASIARLLGRAERELRTMRIRDSK